MDRLQPIRTVTASQLIIVTTTYETELTAEEFLSLIPTESLTTRLLGQQPAVNLETVALELLDAYGDDFRALADSEPDLNPDLKRVLEILNTFDFQVFGKLMLSQYTSAIDGYIITDGNLRSVALALLMMGRQIAYQPVTARYTEIEQSEVEQLTPDRAVLAKTIAATQEGIRHYPVKRKR